VTSAGAHPEISQRDLRTKAREIMDAVEHGQSFTVTRDGHQIGELIPLRRRRRFVSRQEFAVMSRNARRLVSTPSGQTRLRP
jgi:prevent-host-death family protein